MVPESQIKTSVTTPTFKASIPIHQKIKQLLVWVGLFLMWDTKRNCKSQLSKPFYVVIIKATCVPVGIGCLAIASLIGPLHMWREGVLGIDLLVLGFLSLPQTIIAQWVCVIATLIMLGSLYRMMDGVEQNIPTLALTIIAGTILRESHREYSRTLAQRVT